MGTALPDRGVPASGNDADWGEPSREARVRVEKAGLRVEVAVPSAQAPRLLTTAVLALVLIGAVVCPALTLRGVPVDFPVWAAVGLVGGQIGLFVLVALIVRRAFGPGERTGARG
ncbi:hypothetical protein [Saccharothrix sp. Mg75]|uniref:hypothetical protein n=1 Tax=Saccharothrix sp. Mg75 TaxID=3445357 RepID=UPI003EEA35CB